MYHNQLRDDVRDFRLDNCPLGNQGYNRVLLQLFGFTGHGKSALINSLIYVLSKGKYKTYAKSGMNSSGGALTMERRAYELTHTITVVDNRGLIRMTDYEMRIIYAQLGNVMPLNKKVEWRDNYDDFVSQLEDSGLDPNYTDFTVPVFVYKALAILPQREMLQMKDFFGNCRNVIGVFPIVVLTYKKSGKYTEIVKMFKSLGAEIIVAVDNYSEEDHVQTMGRSTDFLMFLQYVLDDIQFRMEEKKDPKEQRIVIKKFLLKYIHDIDMAEKTREEKMKQRARKKDEDVIELRVRGKKIIRKPEVDRKELEEVLKTTDAKKIEESRKREEDRKEEKAGKREEALKREKAVWKVEAKQRQESLKTEEDLRREECSKREEALRREEVNKREEARERAETRKQEAARTGQMGRDQSKRKAKCYHIQ